MRRAALGRYARTVAHLRPAQVAHRVRLRGQRAVIGQWPDAAARALAAVHRAPTGGHWPTSFRPVDAVVTDQWPGSGQIAAGSLTLLGATRQLADSMWRDSEASQLWRFHAHYWDWAWSLAEDGDRALAQRTFARWYRSWKSNTRYGRMDEWAPYVVSLRAWSWCGQFAALVAGTPLEAEVQDQLRAHRDFLLVNLERDVGGNHLLKNLKALVGLGVFLGDDRLVDRATRWFRAELDRQVLPDGGHYERSPAYHCQVLTDVIDVHGLLFSLDSPAAIRLDSVIDRMRCWLDVVADGHGRLPALNDGFPVPGSLLNSLLPSPRLARTVTDLPDTGLTVVERGPWRVVFDNGDPCPDDLPAHAHADTLSVEVQVTGIPLVCDTGTSTYGVGATRAYERSTAAHSTIEIDSSNSTEVWGAFRAGRRARVRRRQLSNRPAAVVMSADHAGFAHLSGRPSHSRSVEVAGSLVIRDTVTGRGRHEVRSRFHLTTGAIVTRVDDAEFVVAFAGGRVVRVVGSQPLTVATTRRAVGPGRTTSAPTLAIGGWTCLPTTLTVEFTDLSSEGGPASANSRRTE